MNFEVTQTPTFRINYYYNDYIMRLQSYSRCLRNRITYANANSLVSIELDACYIVT